MRCVLILCCMTFFSAIYSREKNASSLDNLRSLLSQSPYSIVLFYNNSREAKKEEYDTQRMRDTMLMYRSVSNDDYYKDAKLQFIKADIAKKGLNQALYRYQLQTIPSFVVFLGRQLKGTLSGYAYREDLESFIDRNLKVKMEELVKQADELRKKRLDEARIRAYTQPYYWWGPWSPYWFSPYWYGPYWGPYYGW